LKEVFLPLHHLPNPRQVSWLAGHSPPGLPRSYPVAFGTRLRIQWWVRAGFPVFPILLILRHLGSIIHFSFLYAYNIA